MKFENTERFSQLSAEGGLIGQQLMSARDEYAELLNALVTDAMAAKSGSEKDRAVASAKAPLARIREFEKRAGEIQERLAAARKEFSLQIRSELLDQRNGAVTRLIGLLEGAVAANADVARADLELREAGIESSPLTYPELGHSFESNSGVLNEILPHPVNIETQYSRWLKKCEAAGVDVPRSGPSMSAFHWTSPIRVGDPPQLRAARDFIGRVVGWFQARGASV